jgi:solute:Na+ symporter, SSS family
VCATAVARVNSVRRVAPAGDERHNRGQMTWIDWVLLAAPIPVVIAFAAYTRRYVKSVADFLAGGRCAGRYLICNAKGEAGAGVANTLSKFQPLLVSGFVLAWWDAATVPILLLIGLTGFVVYRYRQTRAMTIGQFFELRYSRRFRLFAGMLGFVAGLLNYGIFPAVSANFFVYFLNLPTHVELAGFLVRTNVLIMASYLSCVLWMMTLGGQITLMVADCVQGILSHAIYLVVIFAVFYTVSWGQVRQVLSNRPPEHSLINPFNAGKVADFNYWYSIMYMIMYIYTYNTLAWQNGNTFSSAARTPHESLMGSVLMNWRLYARGIVATVVGIGALTFLNHPDFAVQSRSAHAALASIADKQVRDQMTVPVALRVMLPAGVKGLFASMMLLGLMAGDSSHILSWGSIFIQDIVLPLRVKPLEAKHHVRMLRWSVALVAVFAFCFSALFRQTQYIVMWWAVTEGVFVAGAGIAIIGGLYWKKGTTAGAWAALVSGAILAFTGIIAPYFLPKFPLNGKQVSFFAALTCVLIYGCVSLLTSGKDFDMDRMLHRGKYAADSSSPGVNRPRLFTADFTFSDKLISGAMFAWSIFWLLVVIGGTIWNRIHVWPDSVWLNYWLIVGVLLPLAITVITFVWFGIGGVIDLKLLFAALAKMKRDTSDDGTVSAEGNPRR